jgi:hypothetical protein
MSELTQNLKTTLQEIGELSALLRICLLIKDVQLAKWKIFRNYSDEGCDLVLMGPQSQIKLEVKSRQTVLVSRNPNQVQFTITKKERDSAAFVIAYWFNRNAFFIVPTQELKATSSNGKVLYKFRAVFSVRNDDFFGECKQYYEDWGRIVDLLIE